MKRRIVKKKRTFAGWIEETGFEAIAKKLNLNPMTVRGWHAGRGYPKITHMRAIRKLTKGVVTYEMMIDGG